MNVKKLTMAQAIIEFLNKQYIEVDGTETKFVKGVMGIFGHGNVVGLGQALEQSKDEIIYYQGKNEQEIAHAAIAYAKQKDRKEIFACTASIGPGSLNMVTAAGTATVNRIPVLLLPSDSYACRQPDPVLQQVEYAADYNVTANDAFKPLSKYWDRVSRPEQLMTAMINAFRVLTDPADTGAVTICIPQDVQGEAYDYPEVFLEKRVWHIDRRQISDQAAQRAVELIKSKRKPMLICGGGVRYGDAENELVKFSEKFNIPFAETQAGKGVIPFDHPLNLGAGGVCGTYSANIIARDCDLIIAVGTRMNDFVTSSKTAFKNHNADILSINVAPIDAYKMNSVALVGDAKLVLGKLSDLLTKSGYVSGYGDEIKNAKSKWADVMQKLGEIEPAEGLSQTRVLIELNKILNDDDIILSASGIEPPVKIPLPLCAPAVAGHTRHRDPLLGQEVLCRLRHRGHAAVPPISILDWEPSDGRARADRAEGGGQPPGGRARSLPERSPATVPACQASVSTQPITAPRPARPRPRRRAR